MVSNFSRTTVLLVDDEPCVREVMELILNDEGFEVSTATDGFDALAQLRSFLPDLIISDLHMPRMSGIEFLSVVRRRFPSIPLIALSCACACKQSPPAGVMADACYPKDCNPDELARAIWELTRTPLSRSTNYCPSQQPRIQTARRIRETNGHLSLLLTCTDCLRTFSLVAQPDFGEGIQQAECSFCSVPLPHRSFTSGASLDH